ncbi:MAG: CBS domain-containing protein [Gammaproteobacteria bacterium]|nr:CBS domain-containing protein [Gammaproteobacteria bacterium]
MFRKAGVKVSDHMVKRPVMVNADTELFEAIHKILVHKISGVTVVDENRKLVGMLSELDCLRAILSGSYYQEEVGTILVKDHMTAEVETLGPDQQIVDVALSMLDHKHRRRPVVDQRGNLLGQLTCRQLLKGVKDLDLPEDWREK